MLDTTVTTQPDTADWYARLAQSLHEVADRIATLAGTPGHPRSAFLSLRAGWTSDDAPRSVPVIDAVAHALGATAETISEGRGVQRLSEHRAEVKYGDLRVVMSAYVPTPPTRRQKMADLQAENAALRAQLAQANGTGA